MIERQEIWHLELHQINKRTLGGTTSHRKMVVYGEQDALKEVALWAERVRSENIAAKNDLRVDGVSVRLGMSDVEVRI